MLSDADLRLGAARESRVPPVPFDTMRPPGAAAIGGSPLAELAAFLGGLVSFFSPCTWPLYPAFLGQAAAPGGGRLRAAALFALGFALVFVALGASATALGAWVAQYRLPLRQVGGLLIVAFGLATLGVLPWNRAGAVRRAPVGGAPAAVALGMAFAVGWTPCVTPVLASILVLAGATASLQRGATLLALYAAGLAVPLLLLGLAADRGARVPRLGRSLLALSRTAGAVMVLLGVLVFTGALSSLATYLNAHL